MQFKKAAAVCWGIENRWTELPIVGIPEGATDVKRIMNYDSFLKVSFTIENRKETWILQREKNGDELVALSLFLLFEVETSEVIPCL